MLGGEKKKVISEFSWIIIIYYYIYLFILFQTIYFHY